MRFDAADIIFADPFRARDDTSLRFGVCFCGIRDPESERPAMFPANPLFHNSNPDGGNLASAILWQPAGAHGIEPAQFWRDVPK